jgi:hypothetical protein
MGRRATAVAPSARHPSAPAVATSAERHQASHVRSAAMTVCTAAGSGAPGGGGVGSGGSGIAAIQPLARPGMASVQARSRHVVYLSLALASPDSRPGRRTDGEQARFRCVIDRQLFRPRCCS